MKDEKATPAFQKCINADCGATFDVAQVLVQCPRCASLLDVEYDWDRCNVPSSLREFEAKWSDRDHRRRRSGVWRFAELLPFARPDDIVSIGEGQTLLRSSDYVAEYVGVMPGNLFLQYEGFNPTGSFKDNGMTAAMTHARLIGAKIAACASTGNTSASLAAFAAAHSFIKAVIFIGSGKIAFGKLSQALDHGAKTIQIAGDFDDAMRRVQEVAAAIGLYLVNSINPFRLEGQKTIMYRVLESLGWISPDWIVVPGGNLGNCSAFGKAFQELRILGLIDRLPRIAVINAAGANTFFQLVETGLAWNGGRPNLSLADRYYEQMDRTHRKAQTLASAIEINRPVNLPKALRTLAVCDGVVRQATDEEILDAKAVVGAGGLGCEPASAASVAGARILQKQGLVAPSDRVVCILTGHVLKDPQTTVAYHSGGSQPFDRRQISHGSRSAPFANHPIQVANDIDAILAAVKQPE